MIITQKILCKLLLKKIIHIFISFKIVLLKKIKKNFFDQNIFIDRFYLFTVDKIYLIKKVKEKFKHFYIKIKKI